MDAGIDFPSDSGHLLSFKENFNEYGVEVIDHIERRRCQIQTPQEISLQEISTERFSFPVDRGVSIVSRSLIFPYTMVVYVRNQSGIMIDELSNGDSRQFPYDKYSIELSAPIKMYIDIESGFEINVTPDNVEINLNGDCDIHLGARSHHEKPAATVTTTSNPRDMMEAISYLGSALKTTTCERSYPTLRGHPPEIDIGEELHIPSVVEKPNTGVEIQVPPEYRSVYIVSPLAYYLAADIKPGNEPKIKTNSGYEYNLIRNKIGFEKSVERVLKKCFFLDCITRTEGYYQISLHERRSLENDIYLDFPSLYELPLSEQLKTYLDTPFDILEPYIPQWKLTAHIETMLRNIRSIPFLVNDLAVIRSAEETVVERNTRDGMSNKNKYGSSNEVDEFIRNNLDEGLIRSGSMSGAHTRSKNEIKEPDEYVQIVDTDSREKTWIGDGIPVDASKGMIEAFQNRIQRSMIENDINITVVVNDNKMMGERRTVDEVYNSREKISFTVDAYQNLTVSELQNVLLDDTDFLHYIGHIDRGGFECSNGQLNVTDLDETGVDTFLLNACSSYAQAIELIKLGSIAGIATFKPVLDSGAQRVGETIARLLNIGFPFTAALDIAKSESIIGENYVIIGDGQLNLTQSKSGAPSLCETSSGQNGNSVEYITYPTRKRDIGSITIPFAKNNQDYFLTSGTTGKFTMENNELVQFLSMGEMPVKMGSKLYWSSDNEFIAEIS